MLATLAALIEKVVGEEYAIGLEIGVETSFQGDLELESIEFVELAEQLMATYGGQVDLGAWLATMDVDEIIGLTVGQLVDHVVAGLSDDGG